MDILLQRHQSVIFQLRKNLANIPIIELLDAAVSFLNNNTDKPTDCLYILTVICNDLIGTHILNSFNNPTIMKHEFFCLISRTFKMLLTKATFIPLTNEDERCFDAISLLITNLCLYKNTTMASFYIANNEQMNPKNDQKFNLRSYEKIFFQDILISKFVRIIETDICINDYQPYHVKYKVIDRLLRLWMKLHDKCHDSILDAVVKCLESELYLNVYKAIDLRQPMLNPKESLFIYQCPKFIRLKCNQRQEQISNLLCEKMLRYSNDILQQHLIVALEGETTPSDDKTNETIKKNDRGAKIAAIAWHIELLNYFALTPTTRSYFVTRFDSNEAMLDQMLKIIGAESLIRSVSVNSQSFHADVALVSYSLALLYNLTFDKKIHSMLKEKRPFHILEKLYKAKEKMIQFASQTLVAILNQAYIDEIESPSKIAGSYLYMIGKTVDEASHMYHGIKLDGVLTNLETVIQNDEVKEEIVNEDEFYLLGECAYRQDLDRETICIPALHIIDAISFAESAPKKISANDLLMDHLIGISDGYDKDQASVAKRILWNVEKEEEFIDLQRKKQMKRTQMPINQVFDEKKAIYQYVRGDYRISLDASKNLETFDILISYCQKDRELCQKVYDRLKASNLYQVSFDEDNSHSLSPKIMANHVESSTIIIMCLSNEYRNSYQCRLEAKFAHKRHRKLIGIIVDKKYVPSKWLSTIVEDIDQIDFANFGFDMAYSQLVEAILNVNEQVEKK